MAVDKNIINSNIYSVVATQALVQVFSWTDSPNRYPSSQKRKLRQSYYTIGLKSHRDWGASPGFEARFSSFLCCAVSAMRWFENIQSLCGFGPEEPFSRYVPASLPPVVVLTPPLGALRSICFFPLGLAFSCPLPQPTLHWGLYWKVSP